MRTLLKRRPSRGKRTQTVNHLGRLFKISQSFLTPKRHDVVYWGALVVACIIFYVMNVLTPLKEDDMTYALVEGEWTRLRTVSDLIRSYSYHYANTNGRVADLLTIVFCSLLGKSVFNVCNALVFGLMAHLISLLSTRRHSLLAIMSFFACVGTCYPVPGETMLWMAGSCNYMWAITTLLALVWYLLHSFGRALSWGEGALLLVGGFLAGAMNEATSLGFFVGLCLYYLCNRKMMDGRAATALTGYLLGIMVIVASPGAWNRAAEGDLVFNLGMGDLLASRWYIFQEKVLRFYLPIVTLLVGIVVVFFGWRRKARHSVWTYLFLALAVLMFVLGVKFERAYAPWMTVCLVILILVADRVLNNWPRVRMAVVIVTLGLSVFTFVRGIMVLRQYKAFNDQTINEIVAAPRQAVLLERQFDAYSRFIKLMNFMSTNFFGHEVVYRSYFEKENVQFVSDSVYRRFHSGRLLDGAHVLPLKSDRSDLVEWVMSFDNQDYMVVKLKVGDLPPTHQIARYYISQPDETLDAAEKERRRNYGIGTEYSPWGYFPLDYQGSHLLILKPVDSTTTRIEIPLDCDPETSHITLYW